jgi:7-carboxy-7-deazaguanine synthase
MLQPATLKITEIFPSIQGEGLRMGVPTIFVRLTGCKLRCRFCDTKYAWDGGKDYTVSEILESITKIRKKHPIDWVCLTGGEPLEQQIEGLVRSLKKIGLKVQIETNGTIYKGLGIDWLTISPKPPRYFFQAGYTAQAKEVKLVVSRELTLETIQNIRKAFPKKTPILLQPESNRKWSIQKGKKLLWQTLRKGLSNIRLSIQLHKIDNFR